MIHPHRLCQLELHSINPKASLAFFAEVFGWPAVPIAIHEYTVLQVPEDSKFGISIVEHPEHEAQMHSAGVVPYFGVGPDLTAILAKVKEQGGSILWGPRPMPGYGQIYCIEDPGGIRIGLYAADAIKPSIT